MSRLEPVWVDLAVFLFLLLIGHIVFGQFEDYKPKWRRILKVVLSVVLFIAIRLTVGRLWGWLIFVVPVAIGLPIVHGWWLPKHGINGWTAEPRDKYLELVTRRRKRST
jgi:hypothetical protein